MMMRAVLMFMMLAAPAWGQVKPFSQIGDSAEVIDYIKKRTDLNVALPTKQNGLGLAPLSDEEKAGGVIPRADLRRVADAGAFGAYLMFCGYNWQADGYVPFIKREQEEARWTDRQMAYIGLAYVISQSVVQQNLFGAKGCTASHRATIDRYLRHLKWGY